VADVQELEAALLRAHSAGDSAAARVLAREIENVRALGSTGLGKGYQPRTSIEPERPSALVSAGRGFMDIPESVRYIASGGKRDPIEDDDERVYQQGRGKDAGFDLMRFGANTAGTMPLTGPIAAGARLAGAAGPVVRGVVGGAQGAIQGALAHTPEGESKLTQTGIGVAGGALAPFAADAVSHVVSKAVQFGKEAAARFAAKPEAIIAELEPVLASKGVKWGDLSDDVRNGMLLQARRQLSVSGELSPDALARKAEMESLLGPGAGPTQGQVTRDPQQWSWERNTQKLNDIGAPITERFQSQMARLRQVAEEEVAKLGGRARNDFQAGTAATEAVKRKMDESKKVVDDLYAVWRESGAGATEVRPQRLADELMRLEDEVGVENIPPVVRARLESFGMAGGEQKKLLTIDEAEKLRKLIGNNDPGHTNPTGSMASQRLRKALDEAVMDTDAPDIPSLKAARGAARARFEMRDSAPGVTAAAKDEAPDKFFQRYVLNGNVRDIQGLKATLNTGFQGGQPDAAGVQAWSDLKSRTLEYAVEKATVKDGMFSGPMFRKALKEIGDERLKVLFEPGELQQIMKLDRVAFDATAEPAFAAVNHSNTAAAGAQYLRDASRGAIPMLAEKATGIPFIGKMAAGAWSAGDDLARNAEMRKRVGQSLMGDAFDPTMAEDKRRALAKLLSGRITPYATTGGVAGLLSMTPREAN
jgi:hypothetical protein